MCGDLTLAMETVPPSGKGGIRGEETLMVVIVMKAVGQLMLRSQNEEWFIIGDWGFVLMAGENDVLFFIFRIDQF